MTAFTDMFPRQLRQSGRRELLILAIAVICYLLGLFLVTEVLGVPHPLQSTSLKGVPIPAISQRAYRGCIGSGRPSTLEVWGAETDHTLLWSLQKGERVWRGPSQAPLPFRNDASGYISHLTMESGCFPPSPSQGSAPCPSRAGCMFSSCSIIMPAVASACSSWRSLRSSASAGCMVSGVQPRMGFSPGQRILYCFLVVSRSCLPGSFESGCACL